MQFEALVKFEVVLAPDGVHACSLCAFHHLDTSACPSDKDHILKCLTVGLPGYIRIGQALK